MALANAFGGQSEFWLIWARFRDGDLVRAADVADRPAGAGTFGPVGHLLLSQDQPAGRTLQIAC